MWILTDLINSKLSSLLLAHNLAKSKAATVDVESSLHNAEHARINKLETEFQPAGMSDMTTCHRNKWVGEWCRLGGVGGGVLIGPTWKAWQNKQERQQPASNSLLKRSFANIKFRKLRTYWVCIFQSKERLEVKCRDCGMKLEHMGVSIKY